MIGAVVLAFLVGISVGVLIGRRLNASTAPAVAPPAPRTAPPGPGAPVAAPNKRAIKAGLTEEAFTPSDDILEKLRLAAEGAIDPTELVADEPPRPAAIVDDPPPPEVDPRLAEAEQRVLDRLRQQQAQAGDDPSDRS